MSIPGQKGNLKVVERKVVIESFLLAKFSATNSLYRKFVENLRIEKKIILNQLLMYLGMMRSYFVICFPGNFH
jgi:hypothetical protein